MCRISECPGGPPAALGIGRVPFLQICFGQCLSPLTTAIRLRGSAGMRIDAQFVSLSLATVSSRIITWHSPSKLNLGAPRGLNPPVPTPVIDRAKRVAPRWIEAKGSQQEAVAVSGERRRRSAAPVRRVRGHGFGASRRAVPVEGRARMTRPGHSAARGRELAGESTPSAPPLRASVSTTDFTLIAAYSCRLPDLGYYVIPTAKPVFLIPEQ